MLEGLTRSTLQPAFGPAKQLRDLACRYSDGENNGIDCETAGSLLYAIGVFCAMNGVDVAQLMTEEQQKHRRQRLSSSRSRHVEPSTRSAIEIYFRDTDGYYEAILKALVRLHVNIIASHSWTLLPKRVAYSQLEISHSTELEIEKIKQELLSLGSKSKPVLYSCCTISSTSAEMMD